MSRGKQGIFTIVAALATVATMAVAPAFAVTISGSVAATDERAPDPVANVDAFLGADGIEVSWELSPSDFVRQSPTGTDFTSGATGKWRNSFVNVNDVAGYTIWRSESGLDAELAGTVPPGVAQFVDALPIGSSFVYSVIAIDAAGNESAAVAALEITLGPPPVANIPAGDIAFGDVAADDVASASIVIANDATEDLANLNVSIVIEGAGFLASTDVIALEPGNSTTLDVSFSAADVGNINDDYTGTLTLRTNDKNNREIVIALSASITGGLGAPDIAVSPAEIGFGQRLLDSISERALTVTNVGGLPLTGTVTLSGDAEFTLTGDAEFLLEEGDVANYIVEFTTLGAGSYSGTITIDSDDADEPTIEVALSGTAVEEITAILVPRDAAGEPVFGWFTRTEDQVGFNDFFAFADNFGRSSADADFDVAFDITPRDAPNGAVDFDDFFLFADNFGRTVANAAEIRTALGE